MNTVMRSIAVARESLEAFWRWWSSELISTYLDWVVPLLPVQRRRGTLEITSTFIELRYFERGSGNQSLRVPRPSERTEVPSAVSRLLENVRGKFSSMEFRLPGDWVLSRSVRLPLAIKPKLRAAVALQLDRLTPFLADDIHFDCQVQAEHLEQGRLEAVLAVTPRSTIDPVLQILLHCAGRIRATAELAEYPQLTFEFLRKWAGRESPRVHRLERGLVYSAAMLLLASVSLWAYQQVHRQQILDQRVAALKERAEATEAVRTSVSLNLEQIHFIVEQLARPREAEAIADLSKTLPADSWVFQLRQQGDALEIEGQSSDVAALNAALAKLPLLENVALRSVNRASGAGIDNFHIAAKLKQDVLP